MSEDERLEGRTSVLIFDLLMLIQLKRPPGNPTYKKNTSIYYHIHTSEFVPGCWTYFVEYRSSGLGLSVF
jgi:hypothetical protein